MNDSIPVVFRYDDGEWEVYALNAAVYGSGDDLDEARKDIRAALALHFEIEPNEIHLDEFQERLVYPETNESPAIWARCHMDQDSDKMLSRREVGFSIKSRLEESPELLRTFEHGFSSFGDVVATVAFEDDMFIDLLRQVAATDRLFVCMPQGSALYWNCLFTDEAELKPDNAVKVSSLNIGEASTVGEFMQVTQASERAPKEFLVPA